MLAKWPRLSFVVAPQLAITFPDDKGNPEDFRVLFFVEARSKVSHPTGQVPKDPNTTVGSPVTIGQISPAPDAFLG